MLIQSSWAKAFWLIFFYSRVSFILIGFLFFLSNSVSSQVNIVQLNCPDSVGFITNMGETKICEFIFEDEKPQLFYGEDFSHQNFHDLIYKDERKSISRAKLVMATYIPKIHHFVFAWNKNNKLLFYYILKDHHEEKLLQP